MEYTLSIATFILPNIMPMGKARPRVTKTGHAFMPSSYRKYKSDVCKLIRTQWDGTIITATVKVTTSFYTPTGNCRSDVSNAHDTLLDCLQDSGVIANDKQVKAGSYEIFKADVASIGIYIFVLEQA